MIQNTINYTHALEKLTKRSSREKTVQAIFTTAPVNTMNTSSHFDTMRHYDFGYPLVSSVPDPSNNAHKLVPTTPHMELMMGKPVALVYLQFFASSVRSSGGAGLSAAEANALLERSLGSPNNAYNQGRIRLAGLPTHTPNWFRPKFVINGNDYFNLDSTVENGISKPEFSEGLALPYEENGHDKSLAVYESINSIDVWGAAYLALNKTYTEEFTVEGQPEQLLMPAPGGVDTTTHEYVFQKFPIKCIAKFIVID